MSELNALGQPVGVPVPDWAERPRPGRVALVGRTVALEPLDPARHGASLAAAFGEDRTGALWTYLSYGPFSDDAALMAWLETSAASEDPLFFAIVRRSDAAALGLAAYLRIDPRAGSIEVGGLAFSPALQRTTLATEAMALMMAHAFDDLGYRRYEWKCDALNAPSRRAAERLGFVFEGVFRQATVVRGRNRDTAWFSVIDREWPALRAAQRAFLAPENFDAAGRQRRPLADLIAVARGQG